MHIHIDFGEGGGNPYFGGSEFIQNICGKGQFFFLFQGFQMRYTHDWFWLYNIDLYTFASKRMLGDHTRPTISSPCFLIHNTH